MSVVKALQQLVGETPYYVSTVEVDSDRKVLILGSTKVFFVENSLKRVSGSDLDFAYEQIESVSYFTRYPSFFKIKFRDQNERPFICEDADKLIRALKCHWQIDCMNRTLCFEELKVIVSSKEPKDAEEVKSMLNGTSQDRRLPLPEECGFHFEKQQNYKFQLRLEFERNQKRSSEFVDTFTTHTGFQNSTNIQVFESIPVDYLDVMQDEKADLQTLCETLALALSDKPNTEHLILSSQPYIKKQNLTQDKAEWSCWQVHMRVHCSVGDGERHDEWSEEEDEDELLNMWNEKDVFFTAVRRKYIPPLMESFQDILVFSVCHFELDGGEHNKVTTSKQFLRDVHQRVVDTLHPDSGSNPSIYFQFVTHKANALLMDEHSMSFFDQQLNIRPDLAVDAVRYVKSILLILKAELETKARERKQIKMMLQVLDQRINYLNQSTHGFHHQTHQCRKKVEVQLSPQNWREFLEVKDNTVANNQAMHHRGAEHCLRDSEKTTKKQHLKLAVWRTKVARFLAYYVDGGLLQQKLTLATLLRFYCKMKPDGKQMIAQELAYLLHAHRRETPEELLESFAEIVRVITPQAYCFNQRVLVALIEEGFIHNILLEGGLDLSGLYPKFLKNMLRGDSNRECSSAVDQEVTGGAPQVQALADLKEVNYDLQSYTAVKKACCRQIIKICEQSQLTHGYKPCMDKQESAAGGCAGQQGDSEVQELLNLIGPLKKSMQSDNEELAALAINALMSLCSSSKEVKQCFAANEGINLMLKLLNSTREVILYSTLKLISVFIASSSDSKEFTSRIAEFGDQEAVRSLLQIVRGPRVGGRQYKTPVYYYAVLSLRQIIKVNIRSKELVVQSEELNRIVAFVEPKGLSHTPPELENLVYQFLIHLAKDSLARKQIIGQKVFKDVIQLRLQMIVNGDATRAAVALHTASDTVSEKIEKNFFQLIDCLSKNCVANQQYALDIIQLMKTYLNVQAQGRHDTTATLKKILAELP